MLYLPFNVYLDSERVSILIEAVWPTLPMLYLPFNVYLDSERVSILIEAVLPTLPMLYLIPSNVFLDSKKNPRFGRWMSSTDKMLMPSTF